MAQSNESVVIGIFDDYAAAERARRDLINAGIGRESIDVKSNLMTGTAGAGASAGSESRGLTGFINKIFGNVPDEDRGDYDEAVRRGSSVLYCTVAENRADEVADIMSRAGAVDIDSRLSEYRKQGYREHDPSAPAYTADAELRERADRSEHQRGQSIPVVQEELRVGKRTVSRGGVRVYSHVVDQPVEEQVRLREEKAWIERRPADRSVHPSEADVLRDQTIEVTETVEEPIVEKRARVTEEVIVGKDVSERAEHVRDSVRHTEVNVERIGGESSWSEHDDDFRSDWDRNHALSGIDYQTAGPAYQYGYGMAGDPRYQGRPWKDVESDLKNDFLRERPETRWENLKDAVRYGWEKRKR